MNGKFKLEFETENAAFDFDEHLEVARILRQVADSVEHGARMGNCRDINGNKVGEFDLLESEES